MRLIVVAVRLEPVLVDVNVVRVQRRCAQGRPLFERHVTILLIVGDETSLQEAVSRVFVLERVVDVHIRPAPVQEEGI